MSAREIAAQLRSEGMEAADRTAVNRVLYADLRDQVSKVVDHRWVVSNEDARTVVASQVGPSAIPSASQAGQQQSSRGALAEVAGTGAGNAPLPPAQARDLRRLQMLVRTSVEWREDPSDGNSALEASNGL